MALSIGQTFAAKVGSLHGYPLSDKGSSAIVRLIYLIKQCLTLQIL